MIYFIEIKDMDDNMQQFDLTELTALNEAAEFICKGDERQLSLDNLAQMIVDGRFSEKL